MVAFQEEMEDFSYTTFLSAVGSDLRFYSDTSKSVELNYEIEQWNTNGTSYVWVQVPALSKDTAIWAYWGGTGPVTVNGGTLGGIGIISGAVTFGTNGGSIAPGSATGTLTINNSVDFTSAGAKRFAVTYNEAGDYSTLAVNGTVTLDSAALNMTVNTAITGIESLFVIVNDGSDAVTGTFAGLPEGALFKVGEQSFSVHYAADSSTGNLTGGNDVLLVSINRGTLLMLR